MTKTAYLTIDDSPTTAFSDKVQYLHQRQLPALFFCIGHLMEQRPQAIIDSIKKGYIIANHSYSHPHFSAISVEQAREEIEKTDQIINDLYAQAKVIRPCKWFRFPYGDKGDKAYGEVFNPKKKRDLERKKAIQAILLEKGYTQPDFPAISYQYMRQAQLFEDADWQWTFDIMEWATFEQYPTFGLKNLFKLFQRLEQDFPRDCRGKLGKEKRWLRASSPEIILLHDHEQTTPIFEAIIDKLQLLGVEMLDFNSLFSGSKAHPHSIARL